MIPGREELLAAQARIAPHIHRSPVHTSRALDRLTRATLLFKCENFQRTGSFKMRGATNAVLNVRERETTRAVATHSSGNFAQAVACAASTCGLQAHIVMPTSAPDVKRAATRSYGARIIDCEPTLAAREATLEEVLRDTGAVALHPYNQYDVIAGQATAGMELLTDHPRLDFILTPVGGGGLLSGTALAARYFNPDTRVMGAEPSGADDAYRSLQAGMIVPSVDPRTIADGLLTSLGSRTFPIIRDHVDRIITVSEDEIVSAMRFLWERMKLIVEPSGAVPLAAVLKETDSFLGARVGIVLSGGNVDLRRLPF